MMELITLYHMKILIFKDLNGICVMAIEIEDALIVLSEEGRYEYVQKCISTEHRLL